MHVSSCSVKPQSVIIPRPTDKRCLTGWRKFQNSCFYLSAGKKSWTLSREYCRTKGADLAILKTQEQMVCFIWVQLRKTILKHFVRKTKHLISL